MSWCLLVVSTEILPLHALNQKAMAAFHKKDHNHHYLCGDGMAVMAEKEVKALNIQTYMNMVSDILGSNEQTYGHYKISEHICYSSLQAFKRFVLCFR